MIENGEKIRELEEAARAGRDARIRGGTAAVTGALRGRSAGTASDLADADRRTAQPRVARFDGGGIGGLRDAPGRGRASRAGHGRIGRPADGLAGGNALAPRRLRDWMRGGMRVGHSPCGVRRIPRRLGFSPKGSAAPHAPAAGGGAARRRQADAADTIPGARGRGLTIAAQDEPVFPGTGANGRKLRPRAGDPVTVCRRGGGGDRTAAFGAPAGD